MNGNFSGIPIIYSEYAATHTTRQIRHHKKRRINKKWRKRYGIKIDIKPQIIIFDDGISGKKIIAHPSFRTMLETEMKA